MVVRCNVKIWARRTYDHKWWNRGGGGMGLARPVLSFHFCLNSNTFGIESIVKVNRLMKNVVEFW